MELRNIITSAIVFTATLLGQATAQDTTAALTLDQCLKTALSNNIAVRQQELLLQTADANYKQAQFNRLPNVGGEMSYGVNSGRSINPNTNTYITQTLSSSNVAVSASLPVFTGWQTQNLIKQNRLSRDASKLEYQQEQDNLTLNVIQVFLQIISNEDVLELTKQQAGVTQKQVERNTVLANEGTIAPATLSDLKGQYATEEIAIVNAENAVQTAKLSLTQLMNVNYNKNLKIDRSGLDLAITAYLSSAEEVYATALKNLAYVKAAELRQQAASKAIKVAAAGRYPTVSLFSQVGTNYSSVAQFFFPTGTSNVKTGGFVTIGGTRTDVFTTQTDTRAEKITYLNQLNNNIGTFVGVNLRVPIFNALQTNTNIKLAKIQEKNAAYVSENTKLLLRQSVETAHLNMTGAYSRYMLLSKQVEAFKESFRAAEIKFNEGVGNSVDYLVVKNNLDRSKLNLTNAQYEYLLRTKVLDFYQGLLK